VAVWSVSPVRVVIDAGPDKLTETPGTTAFVLSATMPLMAPVIAGTVCAVTDNANRATKKYGASPATTGSHRHDAD